MTSGVQEVQSVTFLNFTLLYKTELEDIKGVIRICQSYKNKQYNDERKKDNNTIND